MKVIKTYLTLIAKYREITLPMISNVLNKISQENLPKYIDAQHKEILSELNSYIIDKNL